MKSGFFISLGMWLKCLGKTQLPGTGPSPYIYVQIPTCQGGLMRQVPKHKHLMLHPVLHLPVQMHTDHLKYRCVFMQVLPFPGDFIRVCEIQSIRLVEPADLAQEMLLTLSIKISVQFPECRCPVPLPDAIKHPEYLHTIQHFTGQERGVGGQTWLIQVLQIPLAVSAKATKQVPGALLINAGAQKPSSCVNNYMQVSTVQSSILPSCFQGFFACFLALLPNQSMSSAIYYPHQCERKREYFKR